MPKISYVNGQYVNHRDAMVHIDDRGYQFADGVYEVCEVAHGMIIDSPRHLDRLDRSLGELAIAWPVKRAALEIIMREVVRRNRVRNGLVYLQVSRGVAPRDHVFPTPMVRPALVVTSKKINRDVMEEKARNGVSAITLPENRWARVDIKSTGLLPNVMARQQAKDAGAQEALFVDEEGMILEGAATNVWIVNENGALVTRPAEQGILRGVTRATVMDVAEKLGLQVERRAFSVEEMKNAREVFLTAATMVVMPVIRVDSHAIANGVPGNLAINLRESFFDVAHKLGV